MKDWQKRDGRIHWTKVSIHTKVLDWANRLDPELIQGGERDHNKSKVRIGFENHPDAWPDGVRDYMHRLTRVFHCFTNGFAGGLLRTPRSCSLEPPRLVQQTIGEADSVEPGVLWPGLLRFAVRGCLQHHRRASLGCDRQHLEVWPLGGNGFHFRIGPLGRDWLQFRTRQLRIGMLISGHQGLSKRLPAGEVQRLLRVDFPIALRSVPAR